MKIAHALLLTAVVSLLSGCMTPAPKLDAETLRGYSIRDVSVETEILNDGDSEVAVLRQAGLDPNNPESNVFLKSPAGVGALNAHVGSIVRAAFLSAAASSGMQGSRSATLIVRVKYFDVPSVFRKLFLGGGYSAGYSATLVDSSSGQIVLASPQLSAHLVSGQGAILVAVEEIGGAAIKARPPNVRLSAEMAKNYFEWLSRAL